MGFDTVVYQTGKGKHVPAPNPIIRVETLDFSPSITELFSSADTIICHCGAGTLLDCLKMGKRVIAVVNDTLLNNHQSELFDKLVSEHYIVGYNSPARIMEDIGKLRNYLTVQCKKYMAPSICILNQFIQN